MFEQEITVTNATGLHARPASMLTQFCKDFPEKITLIAGEKSIDPKSVISLLTGGVKSGTTIKVVVEGDNAEEVGKKVCDFIANLED